MDIFFDLQTLIALGAGLAVAVVAFALAWRLRRRVPIAPSTRPPPGPRSAWAVLRENFGASRNGLIDRLQSVWRSAGDAEARFAELEAVLISADVGVKATQRLLGQLRSQADTWRDAEELRRALRDQMRAIFAGDDVPPGVDLPTPYVILVAGVNGVGKTTTIAKLARLYREQGKRVLLVAADTFRAAAAEQLERWAERVGVDCVRHQSGADPGAVAHDGMTAAIARRVDVAIVDTAGRLHVKQHLLEELKKIVRVIARQIDGAPHEALLVIDATTGQNAINQARVFQEALPLTGIVLTKLDGTAKGGAVFAVRAELGVPIRYIGTGEQAADLAVFDPEAFVDAILAPEDGLPEGPGATRGAGVEAVAM